MTGMRSIRTSHVVDGVLLPAVETRCVCEGAMGFDQLLSRNARASLKCINVLREVPQEKALILEQTNEVVGWRWLNVRQVQGAKRALAEGRGARGWVRQTEEEYSETLVNGAKRTSKDPG